VLDHGVWHRFDKSAMKVQAPTGHHDHGGDLLVASTTED